MEHQVLEYQYELNKYGKRSRKLYIDFVSQYANCQSNYLAYSYWDLFQKKSLNANTEIIVAKNCNLLIKAMRKQKDVGKMKDKIEKTIDYFDSNKKCEMGKKKQFKSQIEKILNYW